MPTVGDVVWAKGHHLAKAAEGFAAKLAPRYDGAYQVMGIASPLICKTRHINTKKERTIYIGELKQQQTENSSKQLQQADTTDSKQHLNSKNSPRMLPKESKDNSKDSQRTLKGYYEKSPRITPRILKGHCERVQG